MKLMVYEIIHGEDAITMEDGRSVNNRIYPELKAGREVDLDFSGVSVFASPFFNTAIGQLLRDMSSDELNRLLKVSGLSAVGMNIMRQVITNAKRYYSEPDYRRVLTEVLNSLAAEA